MPLRIIAWGAASAAMLLLSVACGPPALGQQTQGKTAPKASATQTQAAKADEPAAWAVTCSDQQKAQFSCEMTQNIVEQGSGGQVMLISIKGTTGGGSNAMLVRVFHGVYLPAGLGVRIDGSQPMPIQFQKSDRLGVYAALPLNDKLVADLKKGAALQFSMQINKDEPLEINARLTGFAQAYDRVTSIK